MKRCPHCQFIYPDSDSICDFDKTPLIAAAESEIAAITNTPERPAVSELAATHSKNFENRKPRKVLPIAAVVGLLLGVVIFVTYFAVRRQLRPESPQQVASSSTPKPVETQIPLESPSPAIVASPSPTETITTPGKTPPAKTTTAHTTSNAGPVSTSPTNVKKGKAVILLTSGGKVQADEVWRTKDGVWYRRDGVVTLLKKNRVKAIVNQ